MSDKAYLWATAMVVVVFLLMCGIIAGARMYETKKFVEGGYVEQYDGLLRKVTWGKACP